MAFSRFLRVSWVEFAKKNLFIFDRSGPLWTFERLFQTVSKVQNLRVFLGNIERVQLPKMVFQSISKSEIFLRHVQAVGKVHKLFPPLTHQSSSLCLKETELA